MWADWLYQIELNFVTLYRNVFFSGKSSVTRKDSHMMYIFDKIFYGNSNANSIMYAMSASNMHKLQSAPNSLTRVVLPSLCRLSASEQLS